MLNPYTSKYVAVLNLGNGNYSVRAKEDVPIDSVVEVCPVAILSKREAIVLSKAVPWISSKIFIDPLVIDREYQVFAQLGELELERRLDSGEISSEEYSKILRSKINPTALLESKSHVVMLGNGLLYKVSETPNLICEYHADHKVCVFKAIQHISSNSELTYFK